MTSTIQEPVAVRPYSYPQFLSELRAMTLHENNCLKIYSDSDKREISSSPYIAALAARILMIMPPHETKSEILLSTTNYLLKCLDAGDGLIGFLYPNHHRYDIDTLAVCYSTLYSLAGSKIKRRLPAILDIFSKHQENKSGAYYTWLNKANNNIDYVVNLNTRFFFWIIGKQNESLDNYLALNLDDFLENGSPYFRDLSFPLILAKIYRDYFYYDGHGGEFQDVLEQLLTAARSRELLCGIEAAVRNHRTSAAGRKQPVLNQYFNSRDGIYTSNLLDSILYFLTPLLFSG
jgi:hypothetical protein